MKNKKKIVFLKSKKLLNIWDIGINLSRKFDWTSYDWLIAQLSANGLSNHALSILTGSDHLTGGDQILRRNNIIRISTYPLRVHQGPILGPIVFNNFSDDFTHFIKKTETSQLYRL